MSTTRFPIRVLFPNVEGLATDDSSKAFLDFIQEAFQATFYHFFDKFNITMIRMNVTPEDLGRSKGNEILISLDSNLADSAFHSFVPAYLPHNVTASGILASYYKCFLVTFPKLTHELEVSTGLHFLQLMYCSSQQLIFTFFVILIIILWHVKENKSFFQIFWEMNKILSRQSISEPKTVSVKIFLIIFLIGLTIYQAIMSALVDTDKISIAHFTKVDSYEDIYHQNLLPIFEHMSGCSQSIIGQPIAVRNYLMENNPVKEKESYTAVTDMMLSSISSGRDLNRMAILQTSLGWSDFRHKACAMDSWSLIKNPPYASPSPVDILLHPLVMNTRFPVEEQNRLKRSTATLYEQGLRNKRGILAETPDTNPFCMRSHPEPGHKSHVPIGLSYYYSLLIAWMVILQVSMIVFAIENVLS